VPDARRLDQVVKPLATTSTSLEDSSFLVVMKPFATSTMSPALSLVVMKPFATSTMSPALSLVVMKPFATSTMSPALSLAVMKPFATLTTSPSLPFVLLKPTATSTSPALSLVSYGQRARCRRLFLQWPWRPIDTVRVCNKISD
jgi:hypothetical protein